MSRRQSGVKGRGKKRMLAGNEQDRDRRPDLKGADLLPVFHSRRSIPVSMNAFNDTR